VGLFRSQDATQSWSLSSQGISVLDGQVVVFDPQVPSTIYLGTTNGVFRSRDNGTTWNNVAQFDGESLAVDPFDSNHLMVHSLNQRALLESHDGGVTWTKVTNLPPIPNGGSALILAVVFHPTVKGTIFISTQGGGVGIVRSTDGGASYAITNSGLTNDRVRVIAANPQNPTMLFASTDVGIFRSTDGGNSWTLKTPVGSKYSTGHCKRICSREIAFTMSPQRPWLATPEAVV